MLWTMLIKDLRRARHNPWPYLLNLALPLCITALIGLVFGPSAKGGGLGQIKLAVVDEDDSVLSSLLRGAMNQGDFKKHLEARFLERAQALKQISDNKISAVLIIPKGFTRAYPILRWELVIGKVYGRFLPGGVQIIFFLLLGQFILKVNPGQNL